MRRNTGDRPHRCCLHRRKGLVIVILDRKLDRVAKTGSARVNEPTGADSTARPMSSQEPLVQGPFRTQAVIPAQSCVAPNLAALDSAASRRAGAVELLADVGFVEGIYMHRSYRSEPLNLGQVRLADARGCGEAGAGGRAFITVTQPAHPSITTNTAGFKLILDISAQRAESRGESLPAGGYRVSLRHPFATV
ncbi:hypothetical protein ACCO45_000484 [Purpureocillium lilacinum]|uniref:Uncharacterized protein n=1 Tax=Purpureocillium lilacinum TaxID=33203 RepID=A0ACC4E4B9_PURLI